MRGVSKMQKSKMRKVAVLGFIVATITTNTAFAQAQNESVIKPTPVALSVDVIDTHNPYKMIKTVAGVTFKRFANENSAIKLDPNLLKKIVAEELMPHVNYQYSAYKVIGKYLKKTTKQERKDFIPVFRDYLITSYAQVFTMYDNQEVIFAPAQNFNDKKIVAVKVKIIIPESDDIDVSFKVRKNKKTNEWKAFDMVAEGVSLLDSKQAELGGIIRQKGLPYVTEMLKEKSKKSIVFRDKKG